jgi:hypothetical protein
MLKTSGGNRMHFILLNKLPKLRTFKSDWRKSIHMDKVLGRIRNVSSTPFQLMEPF